MEASPPPGLGGGEGSSLALCSMDSAHLLPDSRVLSLGLSPMGELKDWSPSPGVLLPACSISVTSIQQVFIECSPQRGLVPADVDGILEGEMEGRNASFEKESGQRLV